MWCDNCLLIFPLRAGLIALAAFIFLYNLAGSIFLFRWGQLLYFTFPEPQIYGGIGMAVVAICAIICVACSTSSYMWTRVVFLLSPILLFVVAVRAGLMIFRLNYYQDHIIWECNHGGIAWNSTIGNASEETLRNLSSNGPTLPSGFCSTGFHSLYLAFAFSLVIDAILQLYMFFCTWRFKARLENYWLFSNKSGGLYTA